MRPAPGPEAVAPLRRLSARDVALVIVGIVVGAGIFRVPADVAAATQSPAAALGLWLLGGLAALMGALTWAELASRFPSIGGEYHFLRLAFGERLSALFVWARIAIMQTGAIATVAFVAGDHLAGLWPAGPASGVWAALAVIAVTAWNLVSLEAGRRGQLLFVALQLLAIAAVVAAAIALGAQGAGSVAPAGPPATLPVGLALVFIMLAYGGWNEAAYLSAEVRDGGRGLVRALLLGLGLVTALYLLVNAAFLTAFGRAGLAGTPAPAPLLAAAA
ncbi:MAG: APC family permease, partial [Sphingomonadaceae bacterium]